MNAISRVSLNAVLIETSQPEALAEFYRAAFNLPAPKPQGENHLGLNLANTYLGFDRISERSSAVAPRISIWFNSSDFETVYQRLIQLGAKVVTPLNREDSPGEILARLLDPDGNMIGLIVPA